MADRFCPFCGQANATEYEFCQRCGKGLPPPPVPFAGALAVASPAVPPSTAPAPSAVPPAASALLPQTPEQVEEASLTAFERPLTDEERSALHRHAKRPAAGLTRVFGTLTGLVPLLLVVTGMMGTPYVPLNFMVIVIAASCLAIALGGVSLALRMPVSVALASGKVVELRGVPEKQAGGALGLAPVTLGGAKVEVGPAAGALLREARANALAFVASGLGRGVHAGKARALVLGVNGAALGRPETAYLSLGSDAAHREFAGVLGASAKKGGSK